MKPVICSFFTKEYAELAERMRNSAQQFGYETDIIQIEKINDSWLDTMYWRAEFIKQMLEKHQDRDIVWLDCDAVIERTPKLFECFEGDFGICIYDFRWKKQDHLGGTMYFANRERTKQFVDRWIHFNKTMPRQNITQYVIPHAVSASPGLIVINLPASYCQIFDLMKECGDPVISHWQASRKFRN